jgi:hypothetical protein
VAPNEIAGKASKCGRCRGYRIRFRHPVVRHFGRSSRATASGALRSTLEVLGHVQSVLGTTYRRVLRVFHSHAATLPRESKKRKRKVLIQSETSSMARGRAPLHRPAPSCRTLKGTLSLIRVSYRQSLKAATLINGELSQWDALAPRPSV